jgi:putative addiction module component (TIGR02574 family)
MALDFGSYGIDRLSVPERLQLVDFILAGLPEQVDPAEISPELREELDRRCAAADANPQAGRPWREVLDRIQAEL